MEEKRFQFLSPEGAYSVLILIEPRTPKLQIQYKILYSHTNIQARPTTNHTARSPQSQYVSNIKSISAKIAPQGSPHMGPHIRRGSNGILILWFGLNRDFWVGRTVKEYDVEYGTFGVWWGRYLDDVVIRVGSVWTAVFPSVLFFNSTDGNTVPSVLLKGYMYLEKKMMCFENLKNCDLKLMIAVLKQIIISEIEQF